MSDSSSIHTIEKISHRDLSSSQGASTIRSISGSEATEGITSGSSYETDSWETATSSSRGSSLMVSRRTSESISDDDDDYSRRKRRWRRSDGEERTSSSESGRSSYYSTHGDSSGSQTDSDAGHEASDKARSIQHHFIKSRLKHLKTSLHRPKTDDDDKMLQDTPLGSEDRSVFCQNAVSILQRKKTNNLDSQRRDQTLKRSSKDDKKLLVDREIVNRLKIENLLSAMKRASSSGTTDTLDSCQQCRISQEAALQRTFIRNKTAKLENELTEQRVDWEINTKDPLTAIGDLARSLPKPSDNPEEIWARLLKQGIT